MDLISKLSELRCQYNCFDENERDAYHTLSEAIKALSDVPDTNVGDTISRQAAIDAVHKSILDFFDICDDDEESPMTYKDERLLELNKAITTQIKAVPSADVQPVRHGHWMLYEAQNRDDVDNGNYLYFCSNCNHGDVHAKTVEVPFCWFCGARMDGEQND